MFRDLHLQPEEPEQDSVRTSRGIAQNMEAQVIQPLNNLEDSVDSLLTSLTSTNTFITAPNATHAILAADDALTSALGLLKQHQDNYAYILNLRAEADRLQIQLRDTVRTCVSLRGEIGQIHPSILDQSDSESEDEGEQMEGIQATKTSTSKRGEIDYETLLAFAARIGKHNVAAAREAEQDSNRRRVESQTKKSQSTVDISQQSQQSNGLPTNTQTLQHEPSTQNTTEESQAALAAINEALTFQRAMAGMAFQPPDRLRMGALGQLQLLREQQGDEAAEKELDELIRRTENVANKKEETDHTMDDATATNVIADDSIGATTTTKGEQGAEERKPIVDSTASATRPTAPVSAPPKVQKKINLDFDEFNSDEDD